MCSVDFSGRAAVEGQACPWVFCVCLLLLLPRAVSASFLFQEQHPLGDGVTSTLKFSTLSEAIRLRDTVVYTLDNALKFDFAHQKLLTQYWAGVPVDVWNRYMFQRFVEKWDTSMYAIEIIPKVLRHERAAFEKEGTEFYKTKPLYTNFHNRSYYMFTQTSNTHSEGCASGSFVRRDEADEYYPIQMAQPLDRHMARAIGFDTAVGCSFATIKYAEDAGVPIITERIRLIQSAYDQYGWLVFQSVYTSAKNNKTLFVLNSTRSEYAARTGDVAEPKGVVAGVYMIDKFLGEQLQKLYGERSTTTIFTYNVFIYDVAAGPGYQWIGMYDPLQFETIPQREALFAKWKGTQPKDVIGDVVWSTTINVTSRLWQVMVSINFTCEDGFEQLPGSAACTPCPEWLTCMREQSGGPSLKVGYYSLPQDPSSIYLCAEEEACPGGSPGNCAGGRVGLTCSLCPDGELLGSGGVCVPCDGVGISGYWGLFPLLLAILVFDACFIWLSLGEAQVQATFKLACVDSLLTSISVGQTFGMLGILSITWPGNVRAIMDTMSIFALDIMQRLHFQCVVGSSPITVYALRTCFYVTVLACVPVLGVLCRCRFKLAELVNAFGSLGCMLLPAMAVQSWSPFVCYPHPKRKDGSVQTSMVSMPQILCWESPEHLPLSIIGLTFGLMSLGIPALVIFAAYKAPRTQDPYQLSMFRFTLDPFRHDVYYWSGAPLARTILISLVPVMYRSDVNAQSVAVAVIFMVYVVFLTRCWAWKVPALNVVDVTVHVALSVFTLQGALLDATTEESLITPMLLFSTVVLCYAVCLVTFCMSAAGWIKHGGDASLTWGLSLGTLPDVNKLVKEMFRFAKALVHVEEQTLEERLSLMLCYDLGMLHESLSILQAYNVIGAKAESEPHRVMVVSPVLRQLSNLSDRPVEDTHDSAVNQDRSVEAIGQSKFPSAASDDHENSVIGQERQLEDVARHSEVVGGVIDNHDQKKPTGKAEGTSADVGEGGVPVSISLSSQWVRVSPRMSL